MSENISFFEAYEQALTPLFNASNTLALVTRADELGLLRALREPRDVDALAAVTGLDASTVATQCRALAAVEVITRDADTFALAPAWQALTDAGAFVPLHLALGGNAVEGHLLRNGGSYFDLDADERVVYAKSVSPDPFSDDLVAAVGADILKDPDRAGMAEGGRLLELGCGVAGRLLTTLRAMPKLSAVGIELTEDLAAEATRRAEQLSLTDRVEVLCMDATIYRSDEPFDFGFWSQFFFPSATREGALETLLACLRPGGIVQAPLGPDFDKIEADPDGPLARDFAIWRTVLEAWGVPERDPAALIAEFEAAGFVEVAMTKNEGAGPRVRATRP
jgi:hypothetical protein